jgi:hypothetical protein
MTLHYSSSSPGRAAQDPENAFPGHILLSIIDSIAFSKDSNISSQIANIKEKKAHTFSFVKNIVPRNPSI